MHKKPQRLDIIGDVHGFAEPLRKLLRELGYVERMNQNFFFTVISIERR